MRQQVTLYLTDHLLQRFKREATRQGLSLSACLTRHLDSTPQQIDELQQWLATQFDALRESCAAVIDTALKVMATRSGDGLISHAGLEHVPAELMLGALLNVGRELNELPAEDRQALIEKGRAMLARQSGAAK